MKTTLLTALCISVLTYCSYSQFSGSYAPGQWTLTLSPSSNGSVDVTGAPASITLRGSDGGGGSNVDTDYTIVTPTSGIWSFNWSYETSDGPEYDPAGVIINGVYTELTSINDGTTQSGIYNGANIPAGTTIGFRIRATDNCCGDATLTVSGFSAPAGTLPVTFTHFTARAEDESVKLTWGTATETNSARFEVQRSVNGRAFTTISTVAAQGNSAVAVSYTAVDASPVKGTNNYRIREVDIDGKEMFTRVIPVHFAKDITSRVYPNPAASTLTLDLGNRSVNQPLQVNLVSSSGLVLQTRTWSARSAGPAKMIWNVAALYPGVYYFTIDGEATRIAFVKSSQ